MKPILPFAAAFVLAAPLAQAQAPFHNDAVLILEGGGIQRVWITQASAAAVRYRETEVATVTRDRPRSEIQSVVLLEAADFRAALDLYQAGDFAAALGAFRDVKERHRPLEALPGNHSSLAAFFEMESLRQLRDFAPFADLRPRLNAERLLHDHHRAQLELYPLWEAYHAEDWRRTESIARQDLEKQLAPEHRVQAAYCHGMALIGLDRKEDALQSFQIALVADSVASRDLARRSALAILSIHAGNPAVEAAKARWGTPEDSATDPGRSALVEAGAVAHFYRTFLADGEAPPSEVMAFVEYREEA